MPPRVPQIPAGCRLRFVWGGECDSHQHLNEYTEHTHESRVCLEVCFFFVSCRCTHKWACLHVTLARLAIVRNRRESAPHSHESARVLASSSTDDVNEKTCVRALSLRRPGGLWVGGSGWLFRRVVDAHRLGVGSALQHGTALVERPLAECSVHRWT